ncbi:MAG: ABC transporter permease [Myxococcales bacterium]|nr:ABC transporter permease [Myxococcales bacterium]
MRSPLWQLVLFRLRALYREPSTLFWIFAFPLLTSIALGVAFRNRDLAELSVAVADGPGAPELAACLEAAEGLRAERLPLEQARERLRVGRAALVVVPGEPPELIGDPTQPDGRTAKLLAVDALERENGRKDTRSYAAHSVNAPGARYIDFLIPGLLGMSLLSSGVWGIGWALVQMRHGKLLKRLAATPMRRGHFLLSFLLTRTALALVEMAFFVGFARLLFDVRVFGSSVELAGFGLLGSICCGGLGLLVASRSRTLEGASGLMNLATMPMMGLSGVFFSAAHFPSWMQPALKALPLTALNDGLRAIMIDGAGLEAIWLEGAILAAWGVLCYAAALKLFRWQ